MTEFTHVAKINLAEETVFCTPTKTSKDVDFLIMSVKAAVLNQY